MPLGLIAVVGVCASGKSTLADRLRSLGFDARQVLQEHSYVPDMWQRLTRPNLLIYLDASLETVRRRRHLADFEAWILEQERSRLRHAREHCDLYIDTDALDPASVLRLALEYLQTIEHGVIDGPGSESRSEDDAVT